MSKFVLRKLNYMEALLYLLIYLLTLVNGTHTTTTTTTSSSSSIIITDDGIGKTNP